jgi:hypothetical protein
MQFIDVQNTVVGNTDRAFIIERHQEIPDEYLKSLKDYRDATSKERCTEILRVCSVPPVFYLKWLAEGFDINKESARAIVAKLKREGLDHLIATDKRV